VEFCFDIEGVGAVEVDVVVVCGCQVRRGLAGDWVAVGAQRVERVAEVGRGLPSSLVFRSGPCTDAGPDSGRGSVAVAEPQGPDRTVDHRGARSGEGALR